MSKLAIVLAFNQEAQVGAIVGELRRQAPDFDVLVVDDGSSDRTALRARLAGARVLRHPFPLGRGWASHAGHRHALLHGYRYAVQLDADGRHDPRDVPRLLQRLRSEPDVHMAVGSRWDETQPGGTGVRLCARLLSWLTGARVTDPGSSFRIVDRRGIEVLGAQAVTAQPEIDAALAMRAHGLRIAEVGLTAPPAVSAGAGPSNTPLGRGLVAIAVGLWRPRAATLPGARPLTGAGS